MYTAGAVMKEWLVMVALVRIARWVVAVPLSLALLVVASDSTPALDNAAIVRLSAQQAGSNSTARLTLLYVTEDPTVNRTIYSYKLTLDDPSILCVDESTLTLSGTAHIKAVGAAIDWRRLAFTDSTTTWQYAKQGDYTSYSTFDIETDACMTQLGQISYHLDADRDSSGVVPGPVAKQWFQINGTVFYDASQDGVFDPPQEQIIPGVTLALVDPDGNVAETETSNGPVHCHLTGEYLGNYVFEVAMSLGELPDYYMVVVTDDDGVLTEFLPTRPTEQFVPVSGCDVREVDFGFSNPGDVHEDLTGSNKTIGFWKTNIKKALAGKTNGIQVSRGQLLAWLSDVEGLGPFTEPFTFSGTDDEKLENALHYLKSTESGNSPFARLTRQLLAAELNYVSVVYRSNKPDLELVLISYAEYVCNYGAEDMASFLAEELDIWNNLGNG